VQGTIDFYGPVIVTGGVSIKGTGTDDVKFYGGVLAQDVTLDDTKLSGNAMINYSSCAIRHTAGSASRFRSPSGAGSSCTNEQQSRGGAALSTRAPLALSG
jgi:hypothetical protein